MYTSWPLNMFVMWCWQVVDTVYFEHFHLKELSTVAENDAL